MRARAAALALLAGLVGGYSFPARALDFGEVNAPMTNNFFGAVSVSSGIFTIQGSGAGLDFGNNLSIRWKDSSGSMRQMLRLDSGDIFQVGDVAGGYNTQFNAGTSSMTLTSGGLLKPMSFTSAQLDTKSPPTTGGDAGVGLLVFNRTLSMICISTGTGAGAFVRGTSAASGGTVCR